MKIEKRPLSKTHFDDGNVRSACGSVKISIENSYALTTDSDLVTCKKCQLTIKTRGEENVHNQK